MTDLTAHSSPTAAATALRDAGRLDEALAVLGKHLEAEPEDPEALALQVHVLLLANQVPQALQALARAAVIAPNHPSVLRSHARMLLKQGKPAQAQAAAQAAYRIEPRHAETCLVFAATLSAQKQDAPALELVEAALALHPEFAEAFANRAMLRQRAGDAAGGAADAERAAQIKPHMASLWSLAAGFRQRAGNLGGAIAALQQAVQLEPRTASHRVLAGEFLRQAGRLDEALATLEQAVQLAPADANAWINFGTALQQAGQAGRAREAYERALAINPHSVPLLSNMANLAFAEKRWDEALTLFSKAVELQPDLVAAHLQLGRVHAELGDAQRAQASFEKAVALAPQSAEAHWRLGNAKGAQGLAQEAEACYRQALALAPRHAGALTNLGATLQQMGRLEESIAAYGSALEVDPRAITALNNRGAALRSLLRLAEAEASCRAAIVVDPRSAEAHANLGDTLIGMRRFEEAEAVCRRAIELAPLLPEAHANLGNALLETGQPQEAMASFRRAVELRPSFMPVRSNLLFTMAFCGAGTPDEYVAEAREWAHGLPVGDAIAHRMATRRAPRARRKLRVGYVSGDLRDHAVGKFVEPLFRLHDRDRVELFAYSSAVNEDAVTARFRQLVDAWRPIYCQPAPAVARQIEDDDIDVLVDLSGHTGYGRLDVFALRAAPVQAHYVGYFASTGLSQMDYWIGDGVVTPPEHASQFTEEVWRLPRVWMAYEGREDRAGGGAAAWRPADDGAVRLGSFNNLKKMTPRTVALWARVMRELPRSTLLLKTAELADASNRLRIEAAFAAHGVTPDRLDLRGRTPDWQAHMALYDQIDVALDPVGGIGGVTTTCETLWMGVPVIVLAGDRTTGRMSSSLLHGLGHPEWVATGDDDYVMRAAALARDVELRKVLRAGQRDRMRASPLCDTPGLARALEDAYEAMFDRWATSMDPGSSPTAARNKR